MVSQVSGSSFTPQMMKLLGGDNGKSLTKSLAALASGNRLSDSSVDVAAMSAATGLQSEVTSLKGASQNIAQGSSLLQVADAAMEQISAKLDRMTEIAVQSNNGALDGDSREAINKEFQSLKDDISYIAEHTNFNGNNLLDGSFSDKNSTSADMEIANISGNILFAGEDINLLSQKNAEKALGTIENARTLLTSARADVGSMQQSLDFASANIESAMQNQKAADAMLTDTDIVAESTKKALLEVQREGSIAAQTQGNKLNGNLLKLVSG